MDNPTFDLTEKILQEVRIPQYVHDTLISNHYAMDDKRRKWEDTLSIEISLKDFNKSFANIYCFTNVSKFGSFQYRLLHRSIITNIHLFRYKIKSSENC